MVFVLWFTFFFREKVRIFFQVRVLVITKAKRKKICKKKEMSIMSSWKAKRAWLLKCCKNKNSYDMKIYFHSIKIILYLIKHISIISPFFMISKYFHSIKTNLYSIKYILIISPFFSWYQNIYFHSVKNKFVFSKKYFYHIYFFHSSKIWIFHWILFWWAYLVFHL